MANKTLSLDDNSMLPVPVNITINHVDSKSSLDDHIDADSLILTTNLAMLMQTFSSLQSLQEITHLSDQVIKVLKARRELCLRATSKAEASDDDIDITPIR